MRLLAALLILLFAAPAQAQETTFGAEDFTLANGMQVVVIPNHRAPVVTHMVWYKTGAADELPGLSGMAHYLEHLLFKGTAKLEPGEFSKTVKTLGGNDNAFTGQDFTAFFQSIAVEHLPRMMEMEADRMMNLNPPPEHYASEKQVVIEERRERTENDPRGLFAEQMQSTLFINHPYGTPTVGWMEEISKYEWEDVKKFYDRWYAPNNAILVVSGDITAEQLKPMAERIYGVLPAKELPLRVRASVPPAIGNTHLTLRHADIRQPVLQKMFIAPAFARNKQDSLALQVLEEILDGGPTTRLYKALVVEQKKATSVSFSYNATALDYGTIRISCTPGEGVTLEELETLIDAEIAKAVRDGVSEQELKEAIQRLQDDTIYARDSLAGPAMIFGYGLVTGASVQEIETWPAQIASVTAQQVKDVAVKYLDAGKPWIRPAVTGYLLPPDAAEEPGTVEVTP